MKEGGGRRTVYVGLEGHIGTLCADGGGGGTEQGKSLEHSRGESGDEGPGIRYGLRGCFAVQTFSQWGWRSKSENFR